jgi:hypothetical protein
VTHIQLRRKYKKSHDGDQKRCTMAERNNNEGDVSVNQRDPSSSDDRGGGGEARGEEAQASTASATTTTQRQRPPGSNFNLNVFPRYTVHTYHDYSTFIEEGGVITKHKKSGRNFPARLHSILSNEQYSHIISWMVSYPTITSST